MIGKFTAILIAVYFFAPNTSHTQLIFDANPLLKAPSDRLPYYAVGLISSAQDRPAPSCTGFPIKPTVVLTNAHCLYDGKNGRWEQQQFYFPSPFIEKGKSVKAKSYIVPKEFIDSFKQEKWDFTKMVAFDFGAIILEKELDESLLVFSLGVETIPSKTTDTPHIPPIPLPSPGSVGGLPTIPRESDVYRIIVGYSPESVGRYKGEALSEIIYASFCPVAPYRQKDDIDVGYYLYAYKCSATSGMSGAPIFFREGDKYKAIGIHRGENTDRAVNEGIHISFDKLLRIHHWTSPRGTDPDKDRFTVFYN